MFTCGAKGYNKKIRCYLDKKDFNSTGNLRRHAKQCWGAEIVAAADEAKDASEACNSVTSLAGRNRSITATLKRREGSKVTYLHQQHTKTDVTIHPNFHSSSQSLHLYPHHLVPHQLLLSLNHPHQYHLCLESLCRPYLGASTFASTPPWSYTTSYHQSQHRNYRTATCPVLVHPQSSAIQNHHCPLIILSRNPSHHTSIPVPWSVVTTLMSSRIQRDHPNLGGST